MARASASAVSWSRRNFAPVGVTVTNTPSRAKATIDPVSDRARLRILLVPPRPILAELLDCKAAVVEPREPSRPKHFPRFACHAVPARHDRPQTFARGTNGPSQSGVVPSAVARGREAVSRDGDQRVRRITAGAAIRDDEVDTVRREVWQQLQREVTERPALEAAASARSCAARGAGAWPRRRRPDRRRETASVLRGDKRSRSRRRGVRGTCPYRPAGRRPVSTGHSGPRSCWYGM